MATAIVLYSVYGIELMNLDSNRARGFATGLAAAVNYFMAFVATKTYYNLESLLSMWGVTMFYGIIGVIG